MRDVSFCVIGCGNIGERHARILSHQKNSRLMAVCDTDEQKAIRLSQELGCKYYTDHVLMLKNEKPDVANICLPNWLHARIAIDCANNSTNILCEKPMAITVTDAKDMVAAARKNKILLFVVKQNRYNAPVDYAKKLIDEGKLGNLHTIISNVIWNRRDEYFSNNWHGTKDKDGGALYTQASHFLDLMQWFGGSVDSIWAKMKLVSHDLETEDTGCVVLDFAQKRLGVLNYTISCYKKNYEGSIILLGTKGTLKIVKWFFSSHFLNSD